MNKILESYSEEQDTVIAVIQELIPLNPRRFTQPTCIKKVINLN